MKKCEGTVVKISAQLEHFSVLVVKGLKFQWFFLMVCFIFSYPELEPYSEYGSGSGDSKWIRFRPVPAPQPASFFANTNSAGVPLKSIGYTVEIQYGTRSGYWQAGYSDQRLLKLAVNLPKLLYTVFWKIRFTNIRRQYFSRVTNNWKKYCVRTSYRF